MAKDIGTVGVAAAVLSLAAMGGQYSWQQFVVEGNPWDWSMLQEYLRFLITSITIVVNWKPIFASVFTRQHCFVFGLSAGVC